MNDTTREDYPRFKRLRGDGQTIQLAGETFSLVPGGTANAYLASSARPNYNYLINGGFDFAQRGNPNSSVTPTFNGSNISTSADAYGADRWKIAYQGANSSTVSYLRDRFNTGQTFYNAGLITNNTGASKFAMYQIVEGLTSISLRGRTVTFQIVMTANTGTPIVRLGLIYLSTAGAIDTVPAALVPSTWGANSTDPTLGTNLVYIAPASVPARANGTISGNAVSCTLAASATWQLFGGTFVVPLNVYNVIPALWLDSQIAAIRSIDFTQAILSDGDSLRDWLPRLPGQELELCERYYEKSYDVDTAPGTTSVQGLAMIWSVGTVANTANYGTAQYRVRKRGTPTAQTWSYNGALAKASDGTTGADQAANSCVVNNATQTRLVVQNSSGAGLTPPNGSLIFHHASDADL